MSPLNKTIFFARCFALVALVLFSLSPCAVKETLLHTVQVDYSKPLNKSKTPTWTSSCSSIDNNLEVSIAKEYKAIRLLEPPFISEHYEGIDNIPVLKGFYLHFTGNSPPKYILYKRLKIAIA